MTEIEVGKILPVEAAAILHASPQFVRIAMQQGKLPIGTAIKMSSIWTCGHGITNIDRTSEVENNHRFLDYD